MTEQETATHDRGSLAYRQLCEEIVCEHFTALDGSRGDAAAYDLKHLDLDTLERDLRRTDEVLEELWHVAERHSPVALMVVRDAHTRTRATLERVEEFRAAWG